MKIFGLLIFVLIFEVFGQATKSKPETSAKVYSKYLAVTEQSKKNKKISSITGTTCLDGSGKELTPTSKGYRKCVDQARRGKN